MLELVCEFVLFLLFDHTKSNLIFNSLILLLVLQSLGIFFVLLVEEPKFSKSQRKMSFLRFAFLFGNSKLNSFASVPAYTSMYKIKRIESHFLLLFMLNKAGNSKLNLL